MISRPCLKSNVRAPSGLQTYFVRRTLSAPALCDGYDDLLLFVTRDVPNGACMPVLTHLACRHPRARLLLDDDPAHDTGRLKVKPTPACASCRQPRACSPRAAVQRVCPPCSEAGAPTIRVPPLRSYYYHRPTHRPRPTFRPSHISHAPQKETVLTPLGRVKAAVRRTALQGNL